MKVKELIDILLTFDQNALVNRYEYNDSGRDWTYISQVEQYSSGWDSENDRVVYEVFIQ